MAYRYGAATAIVAAITALTMFAGYDVDNAVTAILGVFAGLTGLEVGAKTGT